MTMAATVFDNAFIQALEHRPESNISDAGGIPVVDLSAITHLGDIPSSGGDELPSSLAKLVEEIEAACRDWGFFQVINHGVREEVIDRFFSKIREFFWLPMEEKKKVRKDGVVPLGYYDTEHTKRVRDWKEVFDFIVHEPQNQGVLPLKNRWPENPPQFREACEEYATAVENLGYHLLELISLSLNLPPKHLHVFFNNSGGIVRANHYPPCPEPELSLGIGRHKDRSALTILLQDQVGGLDVKRKTDGKWVRVVPIPGSYIVNVGDILQVWSNDKYESVEHRASVNSEKERFSIPFFFFPATSVNVKPLEELVSEESPAIYDEFNLGEFYKSRSKSQYSKLDTEDLQITDFRKPAYKLI